MTRKKRPRPDLDNIDPHVSNHAKRQYCAERQCQHERKQFWQEFEKRIPTSQAWLEYRERTINAWKQQNPEFGDALHTAVILRDTALLKKYLAADKPLGPEDKQALAGFIELQEKKIASLLKRSVGRPRREANAVSNIEQAERNAAWLLAFSKAAWCEQHGRKRVPQDENEKMIKGVMKEAAKAFDVPVSKISKQNVLNALKSGRIVVRN